MSRRNRHKNRGNQRNPVVRKRNGKKTFPIQSKTKDKHGEEGMMDYLNSLQTAGKRAVTHLTGGAGFNIHVNHQPVEECWETEIKVLNSCGSAPKSVDVTVSPLAMAKINALMANYPKIEWLAYLVGEGQNVTDIVIPRQKVTVVRVDVAPEGVSVPTIGVIHSHHDMGNTFSHTDDTYINQNHNMSLCISHGGIQGVVRVQTACGSYVMVDAKVVQTVENYDHTEFIKEAESLITKHTWNQPRGQYGGNRNNIANLGLEGTGQEIDTVEIGLGIEDMVDTFVSDLEEFPESFEIIDLAAYKEILMEVTRHDRNYDIFMALYNNILDSNQFDDTNEQFLCIPVELLDMIDSEFSTLSVVERNSLGILLIAVQEAIDNFVHGRTAEDTEDTEVEEVDHGVFVGTESEDVCNCLGKCVCFNRTDEPEESWDTGCPDVSVETLKQYSDRITGKGTSSDVPSDNLWDTGSKVSGR